METTKPKNLSKYSKLSVHALRSPEDYEVVEVAANVDKVDFIKINDDHVVVIDGRQLKAIDRHRPRLEYKFYESVEGVNGGYNSKRTNNNKVELRK